MNAPATCLGWKFPAGAWAAVVLAAISPVVPAFAQTLTISPGPPLAGTFFNALSNNYASGGTQNTYVVDAQPFTTPDGTNVTLNSFSVYYVPNPGFPSTYVQATVMEWNKANPSPTGAVLWSSTLGSTLVATSAYAAPNPYGYWLTYTFDTTGLVLDPTKTYAMVTFQNSTADPNNSEPGLIAVSSTTGGPDFGAKTYSSATDPGLGVLESSAWGSSTSDLAYSTTFSQAAIPEPATYALILGLGSVMLVWRRRRAGRAAGRET
ncbi:PEP-CTERM sorting domain-containing protein [Opitutus sp. GAS368]|uniref:PEP-CTERM sorting domain-containing protein n=1 Tax=Opitutus sp. GAS368 TaxID=1882749 RepID=UPI00087CC868|nr:PEP-CTERM sorting domain-containing protein [Opitutus sp. GAS368]SDR73557.1 PEP-CTERM protein-sorting domain-containing protein [Opitutus sp. GAS368]